MRFKTNSVNITLAAVPGVKHTVTISPCRFKGALKKRGHPRTLRGEWTTLVFFFPGNFWPTATVNAALRLLSLQFDDIGFDSPQLFQISDTLCPWLWTQQDRVWSKTMAGDSSLMKATKGARHGVQLNMKIRPDTTCLFIKETVRLRQSIAREHHAGSGVCEGYLLTPNIK